MEAYNSKAVSRIVGVSLRQIQYWDERGFIRPSIKLAEGRGTKRLYSFPDLVCLKVVKDLTHRGLSLHKIYRCLKHLRQYPATSIQPTDSLRYLTDADTLFVITSDQKKILHTMNRQFVLSLGLGSLVRELNGEVQRLNAAASRRLSRGIRKAEAKKESTF